jgi:adenosylcobinamide kinase/adenosylcobinamide-phosphate guanylyltransferase
VLFVATATAGDEEMRRRITEHRESRPAAWGLLEVTSRVGSQISQKIGGAKVVVLDCVTLLVSNILSQSESEGETLNGNTEIEERLQAEIGDLADCIKKTDASFILVSNEVGMGLVPASHLGRSYRDRLGRVNQELAKLADEVYVMLAGLPVRIKPPAY